MDKLILDRAQSAVIARDFGLAARLYKTLLKAEPDNAGILKALGELYVKSGEDEKAIPYFENMLTFDSHNVGAMNSLGGIYRRLKQYEKSIEVLNRALDENMMTGLVNYTLGFTYKDMGNYDDAIDCFENVVSQNPSDVLAYNHLGSIYAAKKDYEKAIQSYRRGLQSDPNHPILQYNLGHAYEEQKNYQEAVKCYEMALKAKPGWIDAIRDNANLLIKCQKTRRASELLHKSVQLYPGSAELIDLQGQIEMVRYNYPGAQGYFENAEKHDPESVKILMDKAESYEKEYRIEEAYGFANQAYEMGLNSSALKKRFVHIMLSANDLKKAGNVLQELHKENPCDVQVLDEIAQYYILRSDDKTAEENFNKITELNPKYRHFLLEAARRYSQLGLEEKAIEFINKYISVQPKNPAAYNLQGRVYERKGDLEKASLALKKAISLNIENVYGSSECDRIETKIRKQNEALAEEAYNEEQEAIKEETVIETPVEEPPENFDFEQMGGDEKDSEVEEEEDDMFSSFADLYEDEGLNDFKDILDDTDKLLEDEVEEEKKFDFESEEEPEPEVEKVPEPVSEKKEPEIEEPNFNSEPDFDDTPEHIQDDTASRLADAMEDLSDKMQDMNDWEPPYSSKNDEPEYEPEPKTKPQESRPQDDYSDFFPPREDYRDSRREEPRPRSDPRLEEKLDDAVESLERAVSKAERKANEAMKKAEEAAERAEELAERAESALQNLEEPLELNKNSEPEPPDLSFPVKESEESDAVDFQSQNEPDFSEPEFEYSSHPEDSFFMPSEENAISETFDQTVTEPVSDALKEAADFLPNIVKMLEDKDCAKEYRQELELFEKLRNLSNFLPPKQREEFLSSKTRLLMDYVIGKMSGKPGLVKTVENLLKSGILDTEVDYESLEREASALTGDELITKVIKDLKYLTEELTDKNLAKALQDSADDVLSRM